MTANELADALDDAITDPWEAEEWLRRKMQEAATMLRNQQFEIEVLKETLKKRDYLIDLILEQGIKDDT